MIVLAIDSATSACSAALWKDGVVLGQIFEPMSRGQSERLIPMVRDAMAAQNLNFADLDLIAVTNGPGAFTGIRIGLSAARTLALVSQKTLVSVTTFRAVAQAIPQDQRAELNLVVLDSRRAELWVQEFDRDLNILSEPLALTPEEIVAHYSGRGVVLAGDGADLVSLPDAKVIDGITAPQAQYVAALAAQDVAKGIYNPADPLYLRAPDVSC